MSKAECQLKVSSSEFVGWQAYEATSPGEPELGNLRTSLICWMMHLVNSKKGGSKLMIKDFMKLFDFSEEKPEAIKDKTKKSKMFWRMIMKKGVK